MAPLRPCNTSGRPRRPNLPRGVQLAQTPQLPSPAAVAAPPPPPPPMVVVTPAAQATPRYSTRLPMPPLFVSSSSTPMVQASDLSASEFSVQDESEIGSYPPGGFLSFMQRSSNFSLQENSSVPMTSNFVHASSHAQYAPFEVQPSEMAKAKSCHSMPEQNTPHSALGSLHAPIVDIDNTDANGGSPNMFTKKDTKASRAAKRMIWTPDETMRLVSAWLKNSNDTVKGNWKRNDQYWGSVTAMFNSTTPANRTREIKQLKEQWHRVNRIVHHFQGCFMKAERIRGSGESDEQVMDHAKGFFQGESDEGEFKLEACWKVLRDQPKWHAYNEDLNGSQKRKNIETDVGDLTANADMGTDLADGIYPQWAAFVKSIAAPQSDKDIVYAQAQESARKDIERAFGVLQSRFNIVDRPARKWKRVDVGQIMQACIILHNMIIEDQRQPGAMSFDLNSTPGLSYALPPAVRVGNNICFSRVLERNAEIRDRETHTKLRNDLVEHIWHRRLQNRRNS